MPDLKILPPLLTHWVAFALTLLCYVLWICGPDAIYYGALPQNTVLLSEAGVLLYTVAVTVFYTIGLTRLSEKYAEAVSVKQRKFFYAGWLIDMSLFWLFGAYCLVGNYRIEKSFFTSPVLWVMLSVYLLLSIRIHFMFFPRSQS